MNKLKFGWAEIDITPDKKVSLAGQFAERISEYVEKPLTATALAVSSGDDQMVIISVDMVSIGWNLVSAVREKLAGNAAGLDPRKVNICAIHTHTGPKYTSKRRQAAGYGSRELLEKMLPAGKKYVEKVNISSNPDIFTPAEMFELLVERLSKIALQAWETRAEGGYINGFERAVVGMCRRAAYSDGSAQMWGDTNTAVFDAIEGGNDSGVELLYVYDANKKLTGVVINVACPAQCVQHRLFVSPDFWGETKKILREKLGEDIFMLPLCSAAGDQCPVDLVRWVEPDSDLNDPNCKRNNPPKRKADPSMFDLAGMRKAGKRVAAAVMEGLEDIEGDPIYEADLVHHVHDMQLPIRRATLTDVKKAEAAIKEYLRDVEGDVDYNDAANVQIYTGILNRFKVQETMDILETEVHVMKLGNIAFATNPFELFLDYGNQIRARSLAEQTFLIQLCNGAEGYLPTKKAEEGGHYSAFIGSGQVGHIGGEQLVRETLKDINGMFSE